VCSGGQFQHRHAGAKRRVLAPELHEVLVAPADLEGIRSRLRVRWVAQPSSPAKPAFAPRRGLCTRVQRFARETPVSGGNPGPCSGPSQPAFLRPDRRFFHGSERSPSGDKFERTACPVEPGRPRDERAGGLIQSLASSAGQPQKALDCWRTASIARGVTCSREAALLPASALPQSLRGAVSVTAPAVARSPRRIS
jgi:hypothetical protein